MVDNKIAYTIANMNREAVYNLTSGRPALSKEDLKNFIKDLLNCTEQDEFDWIMGRLVE